MRGKRGLTLAEVLVTVAIILFVALVVGFLLWRLECAREEARRIRCRSNLIGIAAGMSSYLLYHGDHRFYPFPLTQGTTKGDYNGAEWLAALYWSQVMTDPSEYICPSSSDTNSNGADIGSFRAAPTFGSQTISYAGMHYHSGRVVGYGPSHRQRDGRRLRGVATSLSGRVPYVLTSTSGEIAPCPVVDALPRDRPMASDDTQGRVHHGDRVGVLFDDGHVEFKTSPGIDLERGVGQRDGLLWQLRN
ncbi:prepilin-type N-terminal cleavage/methylation domain-containing protein [Planctomycetota bacterium]